MLENDDYEPEEDSDGIETEHPYLRRITFQILYKYLFWESPTPPD